MEGGLFQKSYYSDEELQNEKKNNINEDRQKFNPEGERPLQ